MYMYVMCVCVACVCCVCDLCMYVCMYVCMRVQRMFVPLPCNTKTRQGEPEVVNAPLKIAPLRPDNDPELLQMHNDKCQLRRARDNLTIKNNTGRRAGQSASRSLRLPCEVGCPEGSYLQYVQLGRTGSPARQYRTMYFQSDPPTRSIYRL